VASIVSRVANANERSLASPICNLGKLARAMLVLLQM